MDGHMRVAKLVNIIGVQPEELRWLRLVVDLLRHPDPGVAQLTSCALLYVQQMAGQRAKADPAGAQTHPRAV
jgi:hypothetical protein